MSSCVRLKLVLFLKNQCKNTLQEFYLVSSPVPNRLSLLCLSLSSLAIAAGPGSAHLHPTRG